MTVNEREPRGSLIKNPLSSNKNTQLYEFSVKGMLNFIHRMRGPGVCESGIPQDDAGNCIKCDGVINVRRMVAGVLHVFQGEALVYCFISLKSLDELD